MKILLVGEYSGFHNSLKEGLHELGHEVTLVASGDGFKSYPSDIKIDAFLFRKNPFLKKIKVGVFLLTKIDFANIELFYRFKKASKDLEQFDAVQLINSNCFLTSPRTEKKILNIILSKSSNCYLHAGSNEVPWVEYMLNKHQGYSSLTPYLENNELKKHYLSALKYTKNSFINHYNFLFQKLKRIIPSDIDYDIVYRNKQKVHSMIPTPINTNRNNYTPLVIKNKITIFCGINTTNQYAKGIQYFTKALDIIKHKYEEKVNIKITKNLPYNEYIKIYDEAHIFLDQCLSYDQGYNGREAMAKGKVVFSGANDDFRKYYNLSDEEMPLIEAKPNVEYLVEKLSELIENPNKIFEISKRARLFIEKEHNYIEIAEKYLKAWNLN